VSYRRFVLRRTRPDPEKDTGPSQNTSEYWILHRRNYDPLSLFLFVAGKGVTDHALPERTPFTRSPK